jgi:hypothetical protein
VTILSFPFFQAALVHSGHTPHASLLPHICDQLAVAHFAAESVFTPHQLERVTLRFVSGACCAADI